MLSVYFITVSVSYEETKISKKNKLKKFNWVVLVGLGLIGLASAVLRLECSLDCIRGSVGQQQHSYRLFYHCQRFL